MLETIKGWYIRFGMLCTALFVRALAGYMTHLHRLSRLPSIAEWEASRPKPAEIPAWQKLMDSWVAQARALTEELAKYGQVGLIVQAPYSDAEKADRILKMKELPLEEESDIDPTVLPDEILAMLDKHKQQAKEAAHEQIEQAQEIGPLTAVSKAKEILRTQEKEEFDLLSSEDRTDFRQKLANITEQLTTDDKSKKETE